MDIALLKKARRIQWWNSKGFFKSCCHFQKTDNVYEYFILCVNYIKMHELYMWRIKHQMSAYVWDRLHLHYVYPTSNTTHLSRTNF